jgi:hypothetical protein
MHHTVEHQRIAGIQRKAWAGWGSYVAARSWGTVRESQPGEKNLWEAFPFEQSRSRAYQWTEDGIGGFCDDQQRLCLAVAFWNGQDPILKERYFGLSNTQGNHGEDVKEYFFYLDGVPSYSYMKMLYKYPQVEFPYERLVQENSLRSQDESAFQLIDALPKTFAQNRYFDIFIEYAKADVDDILCRITAINRGSEPAPLHIIPQLWFRNTWGKKGKHPELSASGEKSIQVQHPDMEYWWSVDNCDELLFTDNETNTALLYDEPIASPYTKDGIDYAVVRGQHDRLNSDRKGTKGAAHAFSTLMPGEAWVVRTRLRPKHTQKPFYDFDAIFEQRQQEADEFYKALQPEDLSEEERIIQRKAFAALNWNKKFYHFNVSEWLAENASSGGKSEAEAVEQQEWPHFNAHDVIPVPDPWEFPYLAAWDFSFQIVTLAIGDPIFAEQQALLLLSDRYMRPDGAIPGFEGDLTTPHPPIYAWAVWHIYQMNDRDAHFLRQAYAKLKLHFEWWLKNVQHQQTHLFSGGFLGMDNISLFDRNKEVSKGSWLAQADGTGWMALFSLNMLEIATELGQDEDAVKYLSHFVKIRRALLKLRDRNSHFFYDVLYPSSGKRVPLKIRSLVGLVPLIATTTLDPAKVEKLPRLQGKIEKLVKKEADFRPGASGCYLLTALRHDHIDKLLQAVFDPDEFYSAYGIRSLSKLHETQPVTLKLNGENHELTYEPGDSSSKMFGGNSNWRGPIWAPINQMVIEALHHYHSHFGEQGSIPGKLSMTYEEGAVALVKRLLRALECNSKGIRPFWGENEYIQTDPEWRDHILFYEHFHAETGQGLGASHQNGWTALIAKLIQTQGRPAYNPNTERTPSIT